MIQLREKDKAEFGASHQLKRLIKKYSNFVGFPISVDVSTATVPVPAAPPCDTCAGGDNGIDHSQNSLRFPNVFIFSRSHCLHPHPYRMAAARAPVERAGRVVTRGAWRCRESAPTPCRRSGPSPRRRSRRSSTPSSTDSWLCARRPRRLPLPPPPALPVEQRACWTLATGRYMGGADPDDGARDTGRTPTTRRATTSSSWPTHPSRSSECCQSVSS
eukprot:COSAG01_NODE_8898_length_2622_cov_1.340864_1_plen_217_part_00